MFQDIKNIYHFFVSVLANIIYQFPAKKIKVVGVTGTDGKTTTVSLIHHILTANGYSSSMVTSIGAKIKDKTYETGFHVTTPSSFSLQKFLKKALDMKSEYFVLEVTSHAIDQHRIWGIPFEVGVITNVSNEHLDYHKTYERYLLTKKKLLDMAKTAVINMDDGSFEYLKKLPKYKTITYGFSKDSDVNVQRYPFIKQLNEKFNQYNCLAAVSACLKLGLTPKQIEKGIESFKLPQGRVDYVFNKDFCVVVDFAHTPNAFLNLLSDLRLQTKGRLIHVFGSAGERDSEKRPLMGEASSKYSDLIILTSEDPRSESAEQIMEEIEKGVKKSDVIKIKDRRQAIREAIKMAKKNDLVVITGKSHEKSMNIDGKELPWDEYLEVAEALGER